MATWEVLKTPSQWRTKGRLKSARALDAMAKACACEPSTEYQGKSDWLVIWGATAPVQKKAFEQHRAAGGNVLCLDMGYFEKEMGAVRMSVNAPHPQGVMQYANGPRPGYQVPELDDVYYNPEGFILIAGMGPKTRLGYGFDGMAWEREQLQKIREFCPGRRIMYRPKPKQREALEDCGDASIGDIEHALRGCALVVVYGSNVGIDCALRGVPCVAFDGAGRFAYSSEIAGQNARLLGEARRDFLNRVAWFNWLPQEFQEMKAFAMQIAEKQRG